MRTSSGKPLSRARAAKSRTVAKSPRSSRAISTLAPGTRPLAACDTSVSQVHSVFGNAGAHSVGGSALTLGRRKTPLLGVRVRAKHVVRPLAFTSGSYEHPQGLSHAGAASTQQTAATAVYAQWAAEQLTLKEKRHALDLCLRCKRLVAIATSDDDIEALLCKCAGSGKSNARVAACDEGCLRPARCITAGSYRQNSSGRASARRPRPAYTWN